MNVSSSTSLFYFIFVWADPPLTFSDSLLCPQLNLWPPFTSLKKRLKHLVLGHKILICMLKCVRASTSVEGHPETVVMANPFTPTLINNQGFKSDGAARCCACIWRVTWWEYHVARECWYYHNNKKRKTSHILLQLYWSSTVSLMTHIMCNNIFRILSRFKQTWKSYWFHVMAAMSCSYMVALKPSVAGGD